MSIYSARAAKGLFAAFALATSGALVFALVSCDHVDEDDVALPDADHIGADAAVVDGTLLDGQGDGDRTLDSGPSGVFDPSFGDGGKVEITFPMPDGGFIYGTSVAVRNDGRVVVGGRIDGSGHPSATVLQLDVTGALDPSFGDGGFAVPPLNLGAQIHALGLGSSGQVFTASSTSSADGGEIGQLKANGQAESSFGTAGVVGLPPSTGPFGTLLAMKLTSTGILAGGVDGTNGKQIFSVSKLYVDGGIDLSFGPGGRATVDVGNVNSVLTGLAVQSSGTIVAAGYALPSAAAPVVFRFHPDGSRDTAFSDGGTPLRGDLFVAGVAVAPDDSIYVCGTLSETGSAKLVVWKLDHDGNPVSTFGNAGFVAVPVLSAGSLNAIAVQPDGRIVVTGGEFSPSRMLVARFLPDGTPDPSFHGGVLEWSDAVFDYGAAISLAPDGKIVVVGTTANAGAIGVWRVLP